LPLLLISLFLRTLRNFALTAKQPIREQFKINYFEQTQKYKFLLTIFFFTNVPSNFSGDKILIKSVNLKVNREEFQLRSRGIPSRILEVRWLPELLNFDCCAIVATIQFKQVRRPSYFQNAGRDGPDHYTKIYYQDISCRKINYFEFL